MSRLDKLHDFIERAGQGATIMVSLPFYDTLRHRSDPRDWQWFPKSRSIYRGLPVRIHDEWSWGWMVRKADGSFVEEATPNPSRPTEHDHMTDGLIELADKLAKLSICVLGVVALKTCVVDGWATPSHPVVTEAGR